MLEEWKAVEGYPGYEVSNWGQVRSYWRPGGYGGMKRLMPYPVRVLKPSMRKNRGGGKSLGVVLTNEAGKKHLRVHRLVIQAFGPPQPPDKPLILHQDDNPRNNCIENLRWGNLTENAQDAIRNGKWNPPQGERSGTAKLTEDQVREMRRLYAEEQIPFNELGPRFGVCPMQACRIINRERWAHLN